MRGNEILTCAAAAVLVVLLVAEALMTLDLRGLLREHLVIGLVLIPPVALKLGSTGCRFARYYTHATVYREKGPPVLPLRLAGARARPQHARAVRQRGAAACRRAQLAYAAPDPRRQLHRLRGRLGPAVLWYLPRVVRSLPSDWREVSRRAVPGAGLRAALVALALGAGLALVVALLGSIDAWHR